MNKLHLHFVNRLISAAACRLLCLLLALTSADNARASVAGEVVEGLIKLAGRTVDDGARIAAREALERGMAKYGTEAAELADRGGFELTEAAARHGDDVWRLARLSADAPRALAARSETMVSLARRWGDEAALVEIKAPGCGEMLASRLAKPELQELAASASGIEIKRLSVMALHQSPTELRAAVKVWERGGGRVLEHLTPGRIAAVGFGVALITAAWKVPGAVITLIQSALAGFFGPLLSAASWGLLLLVLILFQRPILWLVRCGAALARRAYQAARHSSASNA